MNQVYEKLLGISPPVQVAGIMLCASIAYYGTNVNVQSLVISASLSGIRFFTKLQVYSYIMFRKSRPFLDSIFCCCGQDTPRNDLMIIRDGKDIGRISHEEAMPINCSYDFIIHEANIQIDDDNIHTYFIRHNVIPSCIDFSILSPQFITGTITFAGKDYVISNIEKLCIKNTIIFDRAYTQWYMLRFHGQQINDDEYLISFLTKEFTQLNIKCSEYISLSEDSYEVKGYMDGTTYPHLKINIDTCEDPLVWRNLTQDDIPNECPDKPRSSGSSSDSSYELIEETH